MFDRNVTFDTPNWQLKNEQVCVMFELTGEDGRWDDSTGGWYSPYVFKRDIVLYFNEDTFGVNGFSQGKSLSFTALKRGRFVCTNM